jgi:two-component system KDP operon response regulator KdpE
MTSPPPFRIGLVEDDPQIQRFLRTALEAHGYELLLAGSVSEGLQLAALRQPAMMIIDLGLPDASGLTLIRRLREWFERPILVLSARHLESDKVGALDLGADDYLTKPFGIGELLARIRVAERHLQRAEGGRPEARIDLGKVQIDLGAHRVLRDGSDVHLTPIEFELLATLARNRGKVLTHRQLLKEVWGPAHVESPQYLRTFMRSLRSKVEMDPSRPQLLLTEVGVGYRCTDEVPAPADPPTVPRSALRRGRDGSPARPWWQSMSLLSGAPIRYIGPAADRQPPLRAEDDEGTPRRHRAPHPPMVDPGRDLHAGLGGGRRRAGIRGHRLAVRSHRGRARAAAMDGRPGAAGQRGDGACGG